MKPSEPLAVAVGVIKNAQGDVLLSQRGADKPLPDLWEFPGGKFEPGETGLQALSRELHEELGISVQAATPLIQVHYDYPDKTVFLDVYVIDHYNGEPQGVEGQNIAWRPIQKLVHDDMPSADRAIIDAIKLPKICAITHACMDNQSLVKCLHAVSKQGIKLVQFRQPELLGTEKWVELAKIASDWCQKHHIELILNTNSPSVLDVVQVNGVHFGGSVAQGWSKRPVEADKWFSVACHSLAELKHAESIGANMVMLSPVKQTNSHPNASPLGWEVFQDWVSQVNIPVYALGGMSSGDVKKAISCGAQGIAGISFVTL